MIIKKAIQYITGDTQIGKDNTTRRLAISFGVLILIFVSFGVYSLYDIQSISELTHKIYNHPLVVSTTTLQSNVAVTKMHRDMKDVVILQSNDEIQKAIASVKHQEQSVYRYLNIVRDKILGEEGKLLEQETRELFKEWAPIRQEVIDLVNDRQENHPTDTTIGPAAEITVGKGADHVAKLEIKMNALTNYAKGRAAEFIDDTQATRTRLNVLSVTFLVLSLFLFLSIATYTLRRTSLAQIDLLYSKNKLNLIIDTSPIGICTVDHTGSFISTNLAYEKMLGYTKQELEGLSFYDITHPDHRPKNRKLFHQMFSLETGGFQIEKQYIRKDRTSIDVSVYASAVNGVGSDKFGTAFVEDITERKQIERDLLESQNDLIKKEAFITSVMDNLPIGVAVNSVDPDAIFTYMNDAFPKHWHTTREELLKDDNFWDAIFEDEDYRKHISAKVIDDCASGDVSRMHWDNIPIKKDGEVVAYVNARNTPFTDNSVMISTVIDVTGRILAEQDRKKLEHQLQQAQKMEAIGTLAGGIAHDFNNILAAIIGYTELAKSSLPDGSDVIKDLNNVLKSGSRAIGLVKQILSFSRQDESEDILLQPAVIAGNVVDMIRPTIPATIDINVSVDRKTSPILIDPTKLHQIVMNLCTNAFHAMEETGGKLDISLKEITLAKDDLVNKPNTKPGNYIQLSVSDSGMGMTQEVKDKIFDPYFTTKGVGKGTGMGLSIVHGIVKSYEGYISFYSQVGEGTAFHVFLPVVDQDGVIDIEAQEVIPVGVERILFVDDEEILTEMGKDMLERLGYNVTTENSSIEALETFRYNPGKFDLVITDQTMPGLSGVDLSRMMLQIRHDIPIILCTGYSSIISEEKAVSMGIKRFVLKPLTRKDMASLIREVLDKGD
jgi:PAS domain S-box-containing protein